MHRIHRALLLSLTILTTPFVSGASAEPVAVEKCSQECDPQAVNDNTVKTGKEPVNLILYGHFKNPLDQAPVNTQAPDANFEPDLNAGFLTPVLDTNTGICAPPGSTTCPADFHFKNNGFTMFSSPGLVEFLSDGSWRTHQEPGLAGDAKIAGEEIRLYWYMSAHVANQNSGGGIGSTARVGVVPQLGVYARMETGRFQYRGELIAESPDFDEHLPGSPERATMVTAPGQPDVYEFQVRMKVVKPVIPNSHLANGFIVFVQPYQVKTDSQPNEGAQLMQSDWRIRTGVNFPPRLVVPVEEPMTTVASALTIFDDRMFVRWSLLSVMGSYDMRDNQLSLRSTGASAIDPKAIDFIILKRGLDHDSHFKPVNATWAVDYVNHPLADGDYELTASIPNLQGTYLLEQRFPFKVVNGKPDVYEIGGGAVQAAGAKAQPDPVKSPSVGVAVGLVALASIVAVFRRRLV